MKREQFEQFSQAMSGLMSVDQETVENKIIEVMNRSKAKSKHQHFFDIEHNLGKDQSHEDVCTQHILAEIFGFRKNNKFNEAYLLEKLVEKYEDISEQQEDPSSSSKLLLLLLLKDHANDIIESGPIETERSYSSSASKSTVDSDADKFNYDNNINKALVKEFIDKDEESTEYFPQIDKFTISDKPFACETQFMVNGMFKNSSVTKAQGTRLEGLSTSELLGIDASKNKFFKLCDDKL
ncbi:unnamed protein product [Moneuplotes crassus]|uniref:Uncharacterized protein n=1 Tax=Euplotes crassus TaxID=5936 RepID=A0AAD2D3M2_EUPCR|nr:unnamed protein product [Moneuplotes crassus]